MENTFLDVNLSLLLFTGPSLSPRAQTGLIICLIFLGIIVFPAILTVIARQFSCRNLCFEVIEFVHSVHSKCRVCNNNRDSSPVGREQSHSGYVPDALADPESSCERTENVAESPVISIIMELGHLLILQAMLTLHQIPTNFVKLEQHLLSNQDMALIHF